jgi:hypothetical protein
VLIQMNAFCVSFQATIDERAAMKEQRGYPGEQGGVNLGLVSRQNCPRAYAARRA